MEFRKNFNEILDKNLIEIKEYDIEHEKLDDNAITLFLVISLN